MQSELKDFLYLQGFFPLYLRDSIISKIFYCALFKEIQTEDDGVIKLIEMDGVINGQGGKMDGVIIGRGANQTGVLYERGKIQTR